MIKRERCGMNRRVSILFIFMLFFQVVSSGFLPLQAKAEGLEKGIFTKVTITDEEGNEIEEGNESEASVEIQDRKSTRLNSSHVAISYAVFCLKNNKS